MAAKTISVSLPETQVRQIEGTAKREKRSRSEVVRRAVEAYYAPPHPAPGALEALAKRQEAMVLELLRNATISAGKAAELLGISRWDIMNLMAQHGIVMVDGDDDTLRRELELLGFPRGEKP